MKLFHSVLICAVLILMLLTVVQAQPPLPETDPSQAPVDGGLGVLAAAGGAYALKKLREKKN